MMVTQCSFPITTQTRRRKNGNKLHSLSTTSIPRSNLLCKEERKQFHLLSMKMYKFIKVKHIIIKIYATVKCCDYYFANINKSGSNICVFIFAFILWIFPFFICFLIWEIMLWFFIFFLLLHTLMEVCWFFDEGIWVLLWKVCCQRIWISWKFIGSLTVFIES